MNIHRFKKVIKEISREYVPGLYDMIDIVCQISYGRDCISLVVEEPDKFLDVLRNLYHNDDDIRFAAKTIVKPITKIASNCDTCEDELTELLLTYPQKFKERLSKLLNKYVP
ncbi:MAG: hypothetical protein QW101_05970 [Ignisphaera sp.]|uniref:DUF3227 domain-containing protein n=1 Tax=Ignisphaera aggregans TaxID=334771 RepID=A0A7J3MYD9_9CREN